MRSYESPHLSVWSIRCHAVRATHLLVLNMLMVYAECCGNDCSLTPCSVWGGLRFLQLSIQWILVVYITDLN
ncbi:unnamed protein product [Lathyrus oleraceus]